MSLVEVIIGSSIAISAIFASSALMTYIWKALRTQRVYNMELTNTNQLMANIRANPQGFMISALPFELESAEPLSLTQPQFGFDLGVFEPFAQCARCKARLSYAIRPLMNVQGTYVVTLRVTYPDFSKPKGLPPLKVREYRSLVRR